MGLIIHASKIPQIFSLIFLIPCGQWWTIRRWWTFGWNSFEFPSQDEWIGIRKSVTVFTQFVPVQIQCHSMFTFHLSNNVIRIILNVSICPIVQVFDWTKWIHIPTCYTYCPPCHFRLVLKMNDSHFSCVSPTSNN